MRYPNSGCCVVDHIDGIGAEDANTRPDDGTGIMDGEPSDGVDCSYPVPIYCAARDSAEVVYGPIEQEYSGRQSLS